MSQQKRDAEEANLRKKESLGKSPDGGGEDAEKSAISDSKRAAEAVFLEKDKQDRAAAALTLAQAQLAHDLAMEEVTAAETKLAGDSDEKIAWDAAKATKTTADQRKTDAEAALVAAKAAQVRSNTEAGEAAIAADEANAALKLANEAQKTAQTNTDGTQKELSDATEAVTSAVTDVAVKETAKEKADKLAAMTKSQNEAQFALDKAKLESALAEARSTYQKTLADIAKGIACRTAGGS